MGRKITKRPWKVAEITTKTYGQRATRELLRTEFGETCTRQDLYNFKKKYGWYPQFIARDPQYRLAKGSYRIPSSDEPLSTHGPSGEGERVWHKASPDAGSVVVPMKPSTTKKDESMPAVADVSNVRQFRNDTDFTAGDIQKRIAELQREASLVTQVPSKLKAFVPYGDYDFIKKIIMARVFHPIFLTGLSGIGKTLNIKQACAELGREYVRCNITTETEEDDLIGGFRLRNGETYFELGPVVVAMLRGAVLLLDEVDKNIAKIMCLQPVLEGEPLTIKKLGITITPEPGFTVFATANTKGQGDESGKFITSVILDEAFLERFPNTLEHGYPSVEEETKILEETFKQRGGILTRSVSAFFATLAAWANNIRKAYAAEAATDTLSTRRLCHIVNTYHLLGAANKGNQGTAIGLCLKRFDTGTQATFIDLYNKHVRDDGTPTNVGPMPPDGFK